MRTRTVLIAIGGTLALTIGGSTAYAAIAGGPVSSGGVISGCYTTQALNGSHVFVLQDAGATCPKGTTAISWNETGPAGATGPTGSIGPAGAAGPPGTTGAAGPAGANGNTVLNGTGAPDGSLGNNGDFYVDTQADVLYGPKASGTWPSTGTSLVGAAGPAGPAGPQGDQGPAGPAGAEGNTVLNGTGAPGITLGNNGDFYIDTAADVLYGPKAAGTWPDPGVSLVGTPGATGPKGPTGDPGPAGANGTGATVASLAAGDPNCANGGASITDGNGNTAYACTGAIGPVGALPITTEVFNTADLDLGDTGVASTSADVVPGLSDSVPSGEYVMNADVTVQLTAGIADSGDTIGCYFNLDGAEFPAQDTQIAYSSIDYYVHYVTIPLTGIVDIQGSSLGTVSVACFTAGTVGSITSEVSDGTLTLTHAQAE